MNTRLFAAIILAGASLTGGAVSIVGCNAEGLPIAGNADIKPSDLRIVDMTVQPFDGGLPPPRDILIIGLVPFD